MNIEDILKDYSNRVPTISSYYFLTNAFSNRNVFKEFSNEEFFNLVMQLLLFIFSKSIKNDKCYKEDLNEFVEDINIKIYKKNLNSDEIVKLTGYILNGLRNNGKDGMIFNYYDVENSTNSSYKISFIKDTQIETKTGHCILSYTLTTDALKLLLSTKEYDDMYHIQVSQMMANLRIKNGDYTGARFEIDSIINRLNIQQQELSNYLKCVKNDIYFSKKEKFMDVLNNSMNVLIQEMDNYDNLENDIKLLIKDKEDLINDDDSNMFKIKKELTLMKDLIDGISIAKKEAINLINSIQAFRIEYDDILYKMLKNGISSKFDFNDVVLSNMEKSNLNIDNLHKLYNSLFIPKLNEIFYVDTPYQAQNIISKNNDKNIEISEEWDKVDLERKEIEYKLIMEYELYYNYLMRELIDYTKFKMEFTLKEFLNYHLKENQTKYIELTKSSVMFRNMILTLVDIKTLNIDKIKLRLNQTKFTQSRDIQFERVFEVLFSEDNTLEDKFKEINITQLNTDMNINTEINIKDMTAINLTIPDISFQFIN